MAVQSATFADIHLSDNVEVSEKLRVRENDIIICARNGSKKLVGKSALVREVNEPTTFGVFMAICRTPFYEYMASICSLHCFSNNLEKIVIRLQ